MTTHPTPKESAALLALQFIARDATAAIADLLAAAPVVPLKASFTIALDPPPSLRGFVASSSQGAVVKYTWNWGNGLQDSSAASTSWHTWQQPGSYIVGLSVYDAAGMTDHTEQTITFPPVVVQPPIPPVTPPPAGETHAVFPKIYIDSTLPTTTGKILSVPAGGDFQAALNAALPGDAVELANGGTWLGNFQVPVSKGGGWVTVRPANQAVLPVPGTRIGAIAGLPRIMSPNNMGAITAGTGAGQVRFVGLEVTVDAAVKNTGLVRFGTGYETVLAYLPHDFVLDRCYIHGTPTGNLRRAVAFNCISAALIDSYISDCHEQGSDSQAIAGWNGPGPYLIDNCYLEAASENVMFGGADPAIAGLIPSDIIVRRSHITKQLAWQGKGWVVKNLFELKNAQRVLLDACVLENNWRDGQGGSSVSVKAANQGGMAPWSTSRDFTMQYCRVLNSGSGYIITGTDPGATVPVERVTLLHNILDGIDLGQFTGDGRGMLVNGAPIDLTLAHCTIMQPTNTALAFAGYPNVPFRLTVRDNIIGAGAYGVKGDAMSQAQTFGAYLPTFVGNVLITADASGYPVGNFVPATRADVGFASATDLRLAATSPYKNKATDKKDPGADIDAVMAATSGVVIP